MKICQVVAYVSQEGAYGGPTSVAFAQCSSLSAGDVTLLAGADKASISTSQGAYRSVFKRAYKPLRSFGSLFSPVALGWFAKNARSFDIVHIHLARDLHVMPIAVLCRVLGVPYVVQTHGMIKPPRNVFEKLYDRILTRPALNGSRCSFYLTDSELTNLTGMHAAAKFQALRNAVPISEAAVEPLREAPYVILFCSRLHKRKRPELFVAAAQELERRSPERYLFRVVGPDGGELPTILSALSIFPAGNFTYEGAVAPNLVASTLLASDILMLPSINEPFPMIILESLSNGIPAVFDETCGLSPILTGRSGVRVVQSSAESLADAVESLIAGLGEERASAKRLVTEEFSLEQLGSQLLSTYREVLA